MWIPSQQVEVTSRYDTAVDTGAQLIVDVPPRPVGKGHIRVYSHVRFVNVASKHFSRRFTIQLVRAVVRRSTRASVPEWYHERCGRPARIPHFALLSAWLPDARCPGAGLVGDCGLIEPRSVQQGGETRAPGVRFPCQRPKPNASSPPPSCQSVGTPIDSNNKKAVDRRRTHSNVHDQLAALKLHGARRFAAHSPPARVRLPPYTSPSVTPFSPWVSCAP